MMDSPDDALKISANNEQEKMDNQLEDGERVVNNKKTED